MKSSSLTPDVVECFSDWSLFERAPPSPFVTPLIAVAPGDAGAETGSTRRGFLAAGGSSAEGSLCFCGTPLAVMESGEPLLPGTGTPVGFDSSGDICCCLSRLCFFLERSAVAGDEIPFSVGHTVLDDFLERSVFDSGLFSLPLNLLSNSGAFPTEKGSEASCMKNPSIT